MATVEPVSDAIEDDRDLEELWREMERPLTPDPGLTEGEPSVLNTRASGIDGIRANLDARVIVS